MGYHCKTHATIPYGTDNFYAAEGFIALSKYAAQCWDDFCDLFFWFFQIF